MSSKITALAALAAPLPDDVLPVVDVHDTTMAPSGTTKKITAGNLAGLFGVPTFPVTSYGSVTAAITAAQAAGGGTVLLAAATTYTETLPQITGSGIIVRGQGDSSIIRLAPASQAANGQTIGLWVNGGSNVLIENLCIDGNFSNVAKDGGTVIPSTFAGGTGALGAAVSTTPAAGTTETWTVNAAAATASAAYSTPFAFRVDSEWLLCTGGFGTTSWTVRRGFSIGTPGAGAVATHSNGAGIASTNGTLFDATITKYGSATPKTYLSANYAGGVDASTYLQYRMPVRITNAENVTVRNCLVRNSVSAGVLANGTSVNGCTDVLVSGNRITLTWDNGVYFHQGVQYATAEANQISDCMYNGACAVYSDHILFSGNNIRLCGPSFSDSGGVQVNGSSNCDVTGNLIDQCQFYGVVAEATSETNITGGAGGNEVYAGTTNIAGNMITNCHAADYPTHSSPGVSINGAADTMITGNTIQACDYGASAGQKSLRTTISANRIALCSSLGVNVGNSADVIGTIVAGNLVLGCGSHGLYANAPVQAYANILSGNTGMGINLSSPPSGLPRKTDLIIGNTLIDNTDSGILVGGGSTALAIIERNTFTNSQGAVFTDGAANGTTTFTSATAAFTAADAGSVLILLNQGTSGTTLATTIASVTNATTVVLAAAPSVTQTGLTFLVGRGPYFYPDGATTTASNSVLTSATAAFTASDAGKLIVLVSNDPVPAVLGVTTVNTVTNSTTVTLAADFGTIAACGFFISRAAGQQGKGINNFAGNPLIERNNSFYGLPEYQGPGGVVNAVQPPSPWLARRAVADHDYTLAKLDQLVAFTSLTAGRTLTLPAGFGTVTLPFYLDVKDESGAAAANNLTLTVTGGGTVDGAASIALKENYGQVRLYSTGSNWYSAAPQPPVAADASIVVGGSSAAPSVRTATLDVIAAQHPAAADWSNGSHKITSLLNGSAAQDAAAFGQIPVADATAADITVVGTALAAGAIGKWADAGHGHADINIHPADHGFTAWTGDPETNSSSLTPAAGTIYLNMLVLRQARTVSNIWAYINTAGATITGCYLAILDSSGTVQGVTADQSASWTATGAMGPALTVPYSAPAGKYWIALLVATATTAPQFKGAGSTTTNLINANLSGATLRSALNGTGQTTITSRTMSANGAAAFPFWHAVS